MSQQEMQAGAAGRTVARSSFVPNVLDEDFDAVPYRALGLLAAPVFAGAVALSAVILILARGVAADSLIQFVANWLLAPLVAVAVVGLYVSVWAAALGPRFAGVRRALAGGVVSKQTSGVAWLFVLGFVVAFIGGMGLLVRSSL